MMVSILLSQALHAVAMINVKHLHWYVYIHTGQLMHIYIYKQSDKACSDTHTSRPAPLGVARTAMAAPLFSSSEIFLISVV